MPKPIEPGMVGARHEEILERAIRIKSYADKLTDAEESFVDQMVTKLETYKDRAYITVAQLNWLTRLDDKTFELFGDLPHR